ncbi:MAG TPA: site-2 protease family protein [Actinomycetes bacterium]|nr:site-2 protease family protein [Actinomycetes bacterium]
MGDGIPLGRIAGIRVAASWTLLIVVALLVLGLAGGVFPREYPGLAAGWYLAAAAVGAALFLVSLLAHELAHALVARRAGVAVESITFWLFGGVARLSGDAANPVAALWIALVGPLTSLALAGVFAAAASGLRGAGAPRAVAGVPGWLAWTNLGLALFNLLPGAPLDGGRVLRALLWIRSGDRDRSAQIAARAGRVLGIALVGLGIFQIFSGLGASGLWIAFIGWFLGGAARAEEELATARGTLAGIRVRDAMTPSPVAVPASATVAQVLAEMTTRLRFTSLPVLDDQGALVGLVTLRRLREAPPERRAATRVGEVACPREDLVTVSPDEPLADLLGRVSAGEDRRALVLEGGQLVGIVSPADITRALAAADRRGLRTGALP